LRTGGLPFHGDEQRGVINVHKSATAIPRLVSEVGKHKHSFQIAFAQGDVHADDFREWAMLVHAVPSQACVSSGCDLVSLDLIE
jgi:hypothetical protein